MINGITHRSSGRRKKPRRRLTCCYATRQRRRRLWQSIVRGDHFYPHNGQGTVPPESAGEYRIIDLNGNIAYVGETDNLLRRMKEHMRTGKIQQGFAFDFQIADGRSSSQTRRNHETDKIDQHNPYGNQRRGGGGRPAW